MKKKFKQIKIYHINKYQDLAISHK